MHRLSTAFVLGYHGCARSVAERLLRGMPFTPSDNDYDWLGPGIYFWQANPQRALQFAREKRQRERALWQPAVVGAVVDLGYCLDLASEAGVEQVRAAHSALVAAFTRTGNALPQNHGGSDRWLRRLDCAVIGMLHDLRKERSLGPIDTVSGMFVEGGPVYATSGYHTRTHVQICVCNSCNVRGVFRVPASELV